MPVLWSAIALLFVGLALARDVYSMGACMFGMGIFGGFFSVCMNMLAAKQADEQTSARYISLVNAASMLGEFLCPIVFSAFEQMFGIRSIAGGFLINAAEAGILALFALCFIWKKRKIEG